MSVCYLILFGILIVANRMGNRAKWRRIQERKQKELSMYGKHLSGGSGWPTRWHNNTNCICHKSCLAARSATLQQQQTRRFLVRFKCLVYECLYVFPFDGLCTQMRKIARDRCNNHDSMNKPFWIRTNQ